MRSTAQMTRRPRSRPLFHTNKRSNLFAVQVPPLRQLGQHGATNNRPDARHTLEPIFLLTPDRALTDCLVKILVGSLQFRLQPMDMCLNAFLYSSRDSIRTRRLAVELR